MKVNIKRFYVLLWSWTTLIQSGMGQTPLLILINDTCITRTSSAMAMLYDLPDDFSNKYYERILENSEIKTMEKKTKKKLDNLHFTTDGWDTVNSLTSETINNLIKDRRWEALPTIITAFTNEDDEILDYQWAANISIPSLYRWTIPFSLRAEKEAHVFLCDGSNVPTSNCYWFMLQAWSGSKSGFRKCREKEIQKKYNGKAPKGYCGRSTQTWEHNGNFPKFLTEDRWSHFRIVKNGDVYELEDQNGSVIFNSTTEDFRIEPKNIFFHSKTGIGQWKIHQFEYQYTTRANVFSGTTLSLSSGKNCLALFVVMCKSCLMQIELVIDAGVLKTQDVNTENEQWKEVKLMFDLDSDSEVFLRIISRPKAGQNKFWAFNGLRFCYEDELSVLKPTSAYSKYWSKTCQLIENGAVIDTKSSRKVSILENWKNCTENQFGEDCISCELVFDGNACPRKSKYCQMFTRESGVAFKCYCSIGNDGANCQDNCSNTNTYGHGCQRSCKNCQDSCKNDPLSGICDTEFCYDNYMGKKCDIPWGIFIFLDLPELEIGTSSCNMSLKSFRMKGDPGKAPKFYKFQYKEEFRETWTDVTKESLKFNISKKIVLKNLKSEKNYYVRVFGYEANDDLKQLDHLENTIPHLKFSTKCIDIKESQIKIETGPTTARIFIDTENSESMCQYIITFDNDQIRYSKVIEGLEPFREYSVDVKQNNKILFTKYFRTNESTPEKVENFSFSTTTEPSVLSLKWSKPLKENGKLLFYTLQFQLRRYYACTDSTESETFEKSVSASTETWLQANLKPYAEYDVIIKANTSAGFGPAVNLVAKTNPAGLKSEEIPKLISTTPGTDHVIFNFDLVPCEKMLGPLKMDVTITGTENWCGGTKTFSGQQIEKSKTLARGLKPYCNYGAIIKFYREEEKKEITSSFATLVSAPNEITELKVTSKGENYFALRWLPPFPPTGQLEAYKLKHCYTRWWKTCSSGWSSITIPAKRCKLWPDYHCTVVYNLIKEVTYSVEVQAKNVGCDEYSRSVKQDYIATDNKGTPEPPYNPKMEWTENNYLYVSWYHPNATAGTLKKFIVYVNNVQYEYKIESENDYSLIYNMTIKNGLKIPDYYSITIRAHNLVNESPKSWPVEGYSPPPIPDEAINVIPKNASITINFKKMKQYGKTITRFLYVLITECMSCQKQLNPYKLSLVTHHQSSDWVKPTEPGQPPQWRTLESYSNRDKRIPAKITIGENRTNTIQYTLKQNTNYTLAFIWIHKFGNYVRMNYTIVSTGTAVPKSPTSESSTGMTVVLILILITAVTFTLLYIRFKEKVHKTTKEIYENIMKTNDADENRLYDNVETIEALPLRPTKTTRNSINLRHMNATICPGNPLFKTKHSRRIKLQNLQSYVKSSIESGELARQHQQFPRGATKSRTYGELPENKSKNRYQNLIAYNHSRVVLNKIEGVEFSDYINANYIDGYQRPRAYIATQGPKKNTVYDFWRMIWQEKVSYIVMMANVYEGGKKKTEQYWPNNGEKLTIGDFTITFLDNEIHANYEYRKFILLYHYGKPREVGQLHFKAWPDHGVPLYPQSLVPILEKMLTLHSNDFPIVVHCSAGVGRTGTVILCDICLRMAAAEGFVDILAMLEHLRNQRPNMVDNTEQYKLAHLVILICLTGIRTSLPINKDFAQKVDELLQNNGIASQLQYIRDCEWEDDAMKPRTFEDDEELPMFPEKNRFPNITPDKDAAVFLCPHPPTDTTGCSSYINAVQVDAFCEPGRFIVTQYPLPTTVGDFWRLIAEKEISVVVCLNEIPANDKSCKMFYPAKFSELSPVETIKIKHIKNKNLQVYRILTFQMTVSHPYQETTTRTIEIVEFHGWKVREQVPDYTDFITFVDDATNIARKSTPTVIACYDGATASGLFIAMSFIMEKIKLEQECDVCQAIRSIRSSRKQFTNTEEQLRFLYRASVLYVEEKFNQYSNME